MRRFVDLVQISRLDRLIRRKSTGSPEQLAEKLGLSRSSLFEIISYLKEEMEAPIRYDRHRLSYFYEYIPKFHLGFEQDRLDPSEYWSVVGGGSDSAGTDDVAGDVMK